MCNEQTQVSRVATFRMRTFNIVLLHGSITYFYYAPNPMASAIVNAANEGCIGGKGVDGAISCWRAGADGALIPSCWESGSLFKHREGITEVGG